MAGGADPTGREASKQVFHLFIFATLNHIRSIMDGQFKPDHVAQSVNEL